MGNTLERFSLKGKIAVVTGGAQGLGLAMAKALADAGATIVLADINQPLAEQSAAAIAAECGVPAAAVQTDVTKEASAEALVKAVVSRFGGIDVLVNNAGICVHAGAEEMSYGDWFKVIDVNLNGVFLMSKAVGSQMLKQGKGNIINISSMSAIIVNTPQGQCAYNASKAGVMHLTKSLAVEWAERGIRVNTIAPGYMKTDMTAHVFEAGGKMVRKWMDMSPTKRPGEPEELGPLAVYLASEASSFVNGSVITVDGGYTAW
ncbi:MAG: SDR family oxidoreductase [Christensenellaceae bacterium]|jgi:NAD(P)-dependent dehydrogenase (short-subunit alcohol dehydrogenase family)|nr:SDR family oxidoreductase [Christensenellaceae bacterium]